MTNFHWLVARIRLLVSYSLHWVYPPELQACPWAERALGHTCSIPFPSITSLVGPQSEKWEEFEERLKMCFQYYSLLGSKTWFSSWKPWDREMWFPLIFYTCLETSDCSCCLQDKIQTPFSVIKILWGLTSPCLPAFLPLTTDLARVNSLPLKGTWLISPSDCSCSCSWSQHYALCPPSVPSPLHSSVLSASPSSSTELPQTSVLTHPISISMVFEALLCIVSQRCLHPGRLKET